MFMLTWIRPAVAGLRRGRRRPAQTATSLFEVTSTMPSNLPPCFRPTPEAGESGRSQCRRFCESDQGDSGLLDRLYSIRACRPSWSGRPCAAEVPGRFKCGNRPPVDGSQTNAERRGWSPALADPPDGPPDGNTYSVLRNAIRSFFSRGVKSRLKRLL